MDRPPREGSHAGAARVALPSGLGSGRLGPARLRLSPARADLGSGRAQLGVDEGCDDADDGGVVVPCDVLFVELGSPDWLDEPVAPVLGWPERPELVGSVAVDDPLPGEWPEVGYVVYVRCGEVCP